MNLSQKSPKTVKQPRGRAVPKRKATYFAGYAFQRFPLEMPVSDNGKKKKKSKKRFLQPVRRRTPRLARAAGSSAAQRPPPVQKPEPAARRGRGCAGEGRSPGARTSLSDNDRGFMINLGRFKYLLS